MKLAIMIRGHNFLGKDRFEHPMDGRNNIQSLLEKLINPVRALSPGAIVYLATYDSPALAQIKAAFEPCQIVPLPPGEGSQLDTYKKGLEYISNVDPFDALIVARFDTEFKKNFLSWGVEIDDSTIFFPFREYRDYWRDHRRVGDILHIIGRKQVVNFHKGIIMSELSGRHCLHMLYYFLRIITPNMKFIEPGYWDSNTMFANPESNNPLYFFPHRPKTNEFSPEYGKLLPVIVAE